MIRCITNAGDEVDVTGDIKGGAQGQQMSQGIISVLVNYRKWKECSSENVGNDQQVQQTARVISAEELAQLGPNEHIQVIDEEGRVVLLTHEQMQQLAQEHGTVLVSALLL